MFTQMRHLQMKTGNLVSEATQVLRFSWPWSTGLLATGILRLPLWVPAQSLHIQLVATDLFTIEFIETIRRVSSVSSATAQDAGILDPKASIFHHPHSTGPCIHWMPAFRHFQGQTPLQGLS